MMCNRSIISIVSKSQEFRLCYSYFLKFKGKPIHIRYPLAKMCFSSAQRRYDMHWSTNAMVNGIGEFCGVRLNAKRFYRLSSVKRQIDASRFKK